MILTLYLILDGLILLRKGEFFSKYISAMVFWGGILGGPHKICGNPYLNSTTVLFDNWNLDVFVLIIP